MSDRHKYLSSLLSDVQSGKISAVVAASMAGLIEPHENGLSKEAALFRLQWEIENLQD